MKVRDLIKMLHADGWQQVRMRGSNRQFHILQNRTPDTSKGRVEVRGHARDLAPLPPHYRQTPYK